MAQIDTNGHILDVKGVCRVFRIGKNEVHRLVHAGQLPVLRFGKKGKTLRFVLSDVLQSLRERSAT